MLLGVIVFSWSVMGSGCTVAFFVPPKRSRVRPPIYTTVWDVTPLWADTLSTSFGCHSSDLD
jgi:hypothetical protein